MPTQEKSKRYTIKFTDEGIEDYRFWENNDTKKLKKIDSLLDACEVDPFKGIGKPEALKENLSGYWSRRIDKQHRLVYKVQDELVIVSQCRYHY